MTFKYLFVVLHVVCLLNVLHRPLIEHVFIAALDSTMRKMRAEKLDLLGQMKHLYATLENKEEDMNSFVKNFEMKISDGNDLISRVSDIAVRPPNLIRCSEKELSKIIAVMMRQFHYNTNNPIPKCCFAWEKLHSSITAVSIILSKNCHPGLLTFDCRL